MTDKEIRSGEAAMAQKQADEALRENERQFRALFEQAAIGVAKVETATGQFVLVNQRYADIVGYSREELLSLDFQTITYPDDRPTDSLNMKRLASGQVREFTTEKRYRRKDGTQVWANLTVSALWNPGEPATYHMAMIVDITERKRAEETVAQTKHNYETFFDTIDDFLYVLDEQGRMIHTNDTVIRRLGYTREELLGQSVLMVHPPERRDEAGRIVQEMLAGTKDFCPVPVMTKGGHLIPVETRVTKGEWGGRPVLFGVSKDISQLKLSEEKFSTAFHSNAALMALSTEQGGDFIDANETFLTTLGFTRDEVIGKSPADLHLFVVPEKTTHALRALDETGPVRNLEVQVRTKDGTIRSGLFSVDHIMIGEVPCLLTTIVDITERKRVEEAEALRESEERYRTIYDQSPIAIELYDAAGTLVHVNPAGLNLFGIKDVQAIRGFSLFADPNIGDEQKEKLHQGEAVRYQGPLDFERVKTLNLYPTSREGIIWLDVLITPLGNHADSVSGFLMQVQDITERKRAEEALRESEALYQSLVKVSPLGICRKDLAGRFTFANQRFLEALNPSLADLIGLTDFDLHPPELAEKYRRDDQAVMESGQAREFIEERAVLGGESTVVQSYKTPIYDGAGKINGVQISFWDITEHKRAEEALQKSEAQYRLLADNSTDVIWTLDLNGVFTYISPSVFQLRGYTPEEAIRQPLYEVLSKGSIAIVQEKIQQSLEKAKSGTVPAPSVTEVEQPCKDGSSVWTEVVSRLMFDATGKPVGIMGVSRNITERKQADEETQRERAYFDRFVETTPEGIAICDAQGRVMRVNAEFVRMFGYGVDEAVGQCIDDLVAPPGRQEEARAITRSTGQGEKNLLETVRRRKDGTLVDVSLIAAPVLITGKQEAIYSIYRDITERKQAEEARKKAEAQLRQSQKMEAIGTLAGGIAHDFNNLLTGILGNAAIMRSSLPPADPLLENLNAVETAARRAADLTKGLLTFGRSAAVLLVALDVDAAVGETLDMLHQSLPATINIVRDFQPDAWNILADRSQLTQILLNLAVNARDAMEGKGTLTFSVRNEVVDELYVRQYPYAQTGEYVRLSVNDTGPGIPDEIMEHLFEPFHTTKPVGSGTGLGLSVIYGAVKQSGGWITTTTGHDTGTTFNIFLPRCVSPAVPVQTPRPIVENIQHSTVLVVEDEPVVRTVTQSLLTRSGYLVMTAGNGAEASDMIAQHRKEIDLIMLDMTMPGMTTGEIVRAIRALDPTVPILLNSGFASNKTAKEILEEDSVQGFLAKPYDLHQLLEKVQSLLCRG